MCSNYGHIHLKIHFSFLFSNHNKVLLHLKDTFGLRWLFITLLTSVPLFWGP
jgi:hypothetical protein